MVRETAITSVQIVRYDDKAPSSISEDEVGDDCKKGSNAGKFYVKIHVGRRSGGRAKPWSCAGKAVAAIVGGSRRARGSGSEERIQRSRHS